VLVWLASQGAESRPGHRSYPWHPSISCLGLGPYMIQPILRPSGGREIFAFQCDLGFSLPHRSPGRCHRVNRISNLRAPHATPAPRTDRRTSGFDTGWDGIAAPVSMHRSTKRRPRAVIGHASLQQRLRKEEARANNVQLHHCHARRNESSGTLLLAPSSDSAALTNHTALLSSVSSWYSSQALRPGASSGSRRRARNFRPRPNW